ncbi:MAG: xanthine dehydrogenase family protein subunit M [Spirochaetes bacterium]|nr:xanthine dehydrogenase family protein subunit M [Spirochaetota bacterium]
MKNITNSFEYFSPKTLEEALKLVSQFDKEGKDFKVVAGGQSINLVMKQGVIAPEAVISIKGLSDMDYVKFDEKAGLKIGALATHRAIERSSVVEKKFGVLAEMEHNLSSVETRNWGTVAGNICHGDPGGDVAPVLIVLNANVKMAGVKGERTVPAEDFTLDFYETALAHDELVTEIQIPTVPPNTGVAYTKFSQVVGDFALASVAVAITLDSKKDICSDVRIGLGSVAATPLRAKKAEEILRGKKITDDLLAKAAQAAMDESDPTDSVDASGEYKRELVGVFVKRVGKEALERAKKA